MRRDRSVRDAENGPAFIASAAAAADDPVAVGRGGSRSGRLWRVVRHPDALAAAVDPGGSLNSPKSSTGGSGAARRFRWACCVCLLLRKQGSRLNARCARCCVPHPAGRMTGRCFIGRRIVARARLTLNLRRIRSRCSTSIFAPGGAPPPAPCNEPAVFRRVGAIPAWRRTAPPRCLTRRRCSRRWSTSSMSRK